MTLRCDVTALLQEWQIGNESAADEVFNVLYEPLCRIAHHRARKGVMGTGTLVHETYESLSRQHRTWVNRNQFFRIAARIMRRIVIDEVKKTAAAKRGGGKIAVERAVSEGVSAIPSEEIAADWSLSDVHQVIDIDTALNQLKRIDADLASVVEYRYFLALSIKETAERLETSPATVNRRWKTARGWLYGRLKDSAADQGGVGSR